jgi:hypothetical protein
MRQIQAGAKLRLHPTNKRHKQVVRATGPLWVAVDSSGPKPCFGGEHGVLIMPLGGDPERRRDFMRNVPVTDVTEED